jgi:hypothetical protein
MLELPPDCVHVILSSHMLPNTMPLPSAFDHRVTRVEAFGYSGSEAMVNLRPPLSAP